MIDKYFTQILYVTGVITMLPVLQFFLPGVALPLFNLQVVEATGLFYARHWGLLAFCFGALLVYAARHPPIRKPVVLAAGVEKAGLCVLLGMGWASPELQGLHPAMLIDGVCVALYAMWLVSTLQQRG